MKLYYAFEYWGRMRTTTGSANATTGLKNISGALETFKSPKTRDEWVNAGCLNGKQQRVALTAGEARKHRLGQTMIEFKWYALSAVRE